MPNTRSSFTRDRTITAVVICDTTFTADVDDSHVFVNATGGAITVSLPLANAVAPGKEICVKKTDASANAVTVSRTGSNNVEGGTTFALATQNKYATFASDGVSQWRIVASN